MSQAPPVKIQPTGTVDGLAIGSHHQMVRFLFRSHPCLAFRLVGRDVARTFDATTDK